MLVVHLHLDALLLLLQIVNIDIDGSHSMWVSQLTHPLSVVLLSHILIAAYSSLSVHFHSFLPLVCTEHLLLSKFSFLRA